MYRKILVAVDGSAASLRGLDEAIKVARIANGRLRVVHVVDDLIIGADYVPAVYYEPVIVSLRDSGAKVLEQAAAIVRRAEVPCEQKLLETLGGRAADEIVRAANEWPADLIVMGTHGRRGFKRLAMGSDAEMVLRLSPVPVLVVREKPEAS
jgi:Universal stress protein UspA and related nucleotide-binding proteins